MPKPIYEPPPLSDRQIAAQESRLKTGFRVRAQLAAESLAAIEQRERAAGTFVDKTPLDTALVAYLQLTEPDRIVFMAKAREMPAAPPLRDKPLRKPRRRQADLA